MSVAIYYLCPLFLTLECMVCCWIVGIAFEHSDPTSLGSLQIQPILPGRVAHVAYSSVAVSFFRT